MNTQEAIKQIAKIIIVAKEAGDTKTAQALTHAIEHMKRGALEGNYVLCERKVHNSEHGTSYEYYVPINKLPEPPQERKD